MNRELTIPFEGLSQMEVDLLCSDALIAIEIDGAQHFSNPDAYHRDSRKDALLQEHGYFVLRFLAENVSRRLDDVLDAILRGVSRLDRGLEDMTCKKTHIMSSK